MNNSKHIVSPILLLAVFIGVISCEKYTDKKGEDLSDQLTNKYCNIPYAVNYNWNFPGIADNATCFFAYEFFDGNWKFIDTVRQDSVLIRIDTLQISFERDVTDTAYTAIFMNGWCANSTIRFITDRFYNALSDTMPNGDNFQVVCASFDTIQASISKSIIDSTQLSIKFDVINNNGKYQHTGVGIR